MPKVNELLFPSSNDYGVPDLVPPLALETSPSLSLPFANWGSVSRRSTFGGTWNFYIDDYRFEGLVEDPLAVTRTGAIGAIEPNFSITTETPYAVAVYKIYLKRWITRAWQSAIPNFEVWVDLSIPMEFRNLKVLGVPSGWQRYATTAREVDVDQLDDDWGTAVMRSRGSPFTLLVYAGGPEVKAWCRSKSNVIHVPHARAGAYRPGQGTRKRLAREAMENSNG